MQTDKLDEIFTSQKFAILNSKNNIKSKENKANKEVKFCKKDLFNHG